MTHSPAAWEHLGRLLIARRVGLNPEWRNRLKFARDTGLHERLVSDLENARRYGYRKTTKIAIEQAYGLASGSLEEALDNPELTEFPHRIGDTEIKISDKGTGRDDLQIHVNDKPEPASPPGGYSDGALGATERMIWEHHRDRPWEIRLQAIRVLRDGPDPIRARNNGGEQNGSRREA